MMHEKFYRGSPAVRVSARRRFLICVLLAAALSSPSLSVLAQAAPSSPGGVDQSLEPEVTIIHRGEDLVEEYRINGQLYMIKVIPKKGVPYFLVDSDGDGSFDVRQNELDEELLIPQWILFRW